MLGLTWWRERKGFGAFERVERVLYKVKTFGRCTIVYQKPFQLFLFCPNCFRCGIETLTFD